MIKIITLLISILWANTVLYSQNTAQKKIVIKLVDEINETIPFHKVILTSKPVKLRKYNKMNKQNKIPASILIDSILTDYRGVATVIVKANYSRKKIYLNFVNSYYIDQSTTLHLSKLPIDTLLIRLQPSGQTLQGEKTSERSVQINTTTNNSGLLLNTAAVKLSNEKFEILGQNKSDKTIFINSIRSAASDCIVDSYPKVLQAGEAFKIGVMASSAKIPKNASRIFKLYTSNNDKPSKEDSFTIICEWMN